MLEPTTPEPVPAAVHPLRPLHPGKRVLAFLALVLAVDLVSCVLRGAPRVPAVAASASAALGEAREALRSGEATDPEVRERAEGAARRAQELAPEWVAPRRLLDDVARSLLLGPERLRERLEELEHHPGDAATTYLVGRLEGDAGTGRFRQAREVDDELAWAHHGLAWSSFRAGDVRRALVSGERALARARDPWERSFFARMVARYLVALDRAEEASVRLRAALREDQGLTPGDRTEVAVLLARIELASEEREDVRRGFRRAIELLGSDLPTEAEVLELATRARQAESEVGREAARAELELALAGRSSPVRDTLLSELLHDASFTALAARLGERARAERADPAPDEDATQRARRFAAGERAAVIEDWLRGLPRRVLDDAGRPRDPALGRLEAAARAAEAGGAEADRELARALLDAGWYREARGLATSLAERDLDGALGVYREALRGIALFEEVGALVGRTDRTRTAPLEWRSAEDDASRLVPADPDEERPSLASLDSLLEALEPFFERFPLEPPVSTIPLRESPRLRYAPVAQVVHPGPVFSEADEAAGLGRAGEPVPGLAAELARRGRFGIFGEALGGGGPDGTVLRRLWIEHRSGEHLGVPFEGTVAWCDGTDVPSRPVRRGASIVGAALHEGYWVDVGGQRDDLARWRRLEERWLRDEPALAERVLAQEGPRLPENATARRLAETLPYAPGDLAQLLRLAVLRDRAGEGRDELVTLDELVELTALHEEGHLTDRTRFLPLLAHWREVLGLLVRARFSPTEIGELLEYRAQLVALCAAPDPRLPLADCAGALDGATGGTPHAAAYRRLVADWLEVWVEDERERATEEGRPTFWGDGYPLHALHRLAPEEVRRVSLALAGRRGMVR